jgi:S1-C subfamily serine protease
VPPGGPAATAGIQVCDFTVAVGGQTIDADHSFVRAVFSHKPGDTVDATINRDGQASSRASTPRSDPPFGTGVA